MRRRILTFGLPVLLALPVVYLGTAGAGAKPVEFSDARLKVEINATDGDAGLQIFLDGEAWNEVELFDPMGTAVLDVDVTGRAEDFGLTELFSESSEPPFEEFPLAQFKELFPEGSYTFRGSTSMVRRSPLRRRSPTTSLTARRSCRRRPTRGCGQTVSWWSGRPSPPQPGLTSSAIRCWWSKNSRSCGCSALTCRRPPPGSRSPPNSSSRGPSTRSRSSRSRPAEIRRSPNSPSGPHGPPEEACPPDEASADHDTSATSASSTRRARTTTPNDAEPVPPTAPDRHDRAPHVGAMPLRRCHVPTGIPHETPLEYISVGSRGRLAAGWDAKGVVCLVTYRRHYVRRSGRGSAGRRRGARCASRVVL